ncbi:MAG: hypothetical protein ABI406_05955 [Ktedonobacteraceae bacterium]
MTVNEEGSTEPSPVGDGSVDQQQQTDQQPVEDIGDVGAVQRSPEAKLLTRPYDPLKFHDMVRSITNYSFLGIFALTVVASLYVVIWRGSDWTNERDLLQLLLPAETALPGSAVGFYFGSQANKSGGK